MDSLRNMFNKCKCEKLPLNYLNYHDIYTITDKKGGEIKFRECINCHQNWLSYHIEYPHYSKSGRWYIAKIHKTKLELITPKNTIEFLENSDWYFYGGSYFNNTGKKGKGKLRID